MYKVIATLFIFCAWVGVAKASAILSLTPDIANGEAHVLLNLNTDNHVVNGFDVHIKYDTEHLKFIGYSGEQGVATLWVTPPYAANSEVILSGIIPGGASVTYDPRNLENEKLQLTKLIFKVQKTGDTDLRITDSAVFLNDGLGTKLAHEVKNTTLGIKNTDASSPENNRDTNPPQNFGIDIIPKSKEARTPMLITFSTTDESGIASYKIKKNGDWQEVVSPYAVKQSLFSQRINVRAYDTSGNITESSVTIPSIVPWYVIVFLLVVLAGFYLYKLLK